MTERHNPYDHHSNTWLRGSFHGHCSEYSRCASVPLAESVRRYSEVGAGFFSLTDHDHVTDLSTMRSQYPEPVSYTHLTLPTKVAV